MTARAERYRQGSTSFPCAGIAPSQPVAPLALAEEVIALAGIGGTGIGVDSLSSYLTAFDARVESTRLPSGIVGRSHLSPDGHLVEVDGSAPSSRKWFTVAHEVGHMLVDEARFDLDLGPRLPRTHVELERLCDDIAGRILLPSARVADLARPVLASGRLFSAALTCGMSPEAFAIRLNEEGFPNLYARLKRARTPKPERWCVERVRGAIGQNLAFRGLNWARIEELPLGTTTYSGSRGRKDWNIPFPVIGEVRKGSHIASLWFSTVVPEPPVSGSCSAEQR